MVRYVGLRRRVCEELRIAAPHLTSVVHELSETPGCEETDARIKRTARFLVTRRALCFEAQSRTDSADSEVPGVMAAAAHGPRAARGALPPEGESDATFAKCCTTTKRRRSAPRTSCCARCKISIFLSRSTVRWFRRPSRLPCSRIICLPLTQRPRALWSPRGATNTSTPNFWLFLKQCTAGGCGSGTVRARSSVRMRMVVRSIWLANLSSSFYDD